MSEASPRAELVGACHCGRVRVTVPGDAAGVFACHCSDCQRLHGNFFAFLVTAKHSVRWEGEAHVRWVHSSAANERAFCAECGSRLAKRPVDGDRIMVSVGLFDRALPRKVEKNLWLTEKPTWYEAPRVGPIGPEELVALALAAPIRTPLAEYGYAQRVASGSSRPPGVIALTWIAAKDAEERERIRAHAKANVEEFLTEPGFISIVTGFTGLRGFTVTAWEDEAAMKRALAKHHATARQELFGERFVAAVWTSVWSPTRMNRLWVRCPTCGTLEDVTDDHRACSGCHVELPERPAFW